MDNSHSEQSPTNREEVKKEKDIRRDDSLGLQGYKMRIVIRVISSAVGGIVLFVGIVLLLANLYGIHTTAINAVGIISIVIGIYLIYVIALKSR